MRSDLIGGGIFFPPNSVVGLLVCFAGFFQKEYKPSKFSHCGGIFEQDGELYFLDAVFPKVRAVPLEKAVKGRKCEIRKLKSYFRISLDVEAYNKYCIEAIGQPYNLLGAVASGLDKPFEIGVKTASHCSHRLTESLQAGKVVSRYINAREDVPDDCYSFPVWDKEPVIL